MLDRLPRAPFCVVSLFASLVLAACGGSKEPAAGPAPIASGTAVVATGTGEPKAAPAPLGVLPGLNMYARARDVRSLSDYAMKQAKVPASMLDAIGQMTFGSAAWSVIDLDAPAGALAIQSEVGNAGDLQFALAFSTDAAKTATELPKMKTSTKKNLRFFHGGKKSDRMVCALESITAKAYVICSTTEDAIVDLAPYLATRLATWDTQEQVSVFIPGESWRAMVLSTFDKDREKKKEGDKGEDVATAAAMNVGRESLEDLGDLWFEGSLEQSGGVHGKMRMELHAEKSMATRIYLSDSKRGNPLEAIKTMPSDVQVAFATRGAAADDLKEAKKALLALLGALMTSDNTMTESEAKDVGALLDSVFLTGGPLAAGWGIDPKAADKAAAAFSKGKDTPAARVAAENVTDGYWFACVAEPQDKWVDAVKRFDALATASEKNKKTTAPKKPATGTTTSHTTVVASSPKLPAGSVHIVSKTTPTKPGAGGGYSEHVFIAGRGEHTCGIAARDEGLAVSKLLALLDNTGDKLTKTMPALASYTPGDDVRSLFVSNIAGVTRLNWHSNPLLWAKHANTAKALATLPAKGEQPFFATDRVVRGKSTRAVELALTMNADALADAIAHLREQKDAHEACGGPGEPPCPAPCDGPGQPPCSALPAPPPPPPLRPRKK